MIDQPESPCLVALSKLRDDLLAPSELNRADFVERIRQALGCLPLPNDPYDAYIGGPGSWSSWLGEHGSIPAKGLDGTEATRLSLRSLLGQMRWNAPSTLHNVNQPILLSTAAANAIMSLYNPNALWDLVSGGCLELERQVVRQLADLMNWDPEQADGLFTFGGKAGMMYGIRLGMNRCLPGSARSGLSNCAEPVVLTTTENHYTVEYAAAMLGIGRDNVVYVPTTSRQMDVGILRSLIADLVSAGRAIACVLLCGVNTLDGVVDPIVEVAATIDDSVARYHLPYHPWIHFDLPLGWVWLFFRDYDFERNPLGIEQDGLLGAERVVERLAGAGLADSTCFDFHKLGFAPYSTSVFLLRDWKALRSINGEDAPEKAWHRHGANFRQHHSLEHSRSAAPIVAAWTTLQALGRDGFRAYLGHMHSLTSYLRRRLAATGSVVVINADSPSFATMSVPHVPTTGRTLQARDPAVGAVLQNRYTESLFWYVNGMRGDAQGSMAIGYVPGYVSEGDSTPLSALRVYLTNPHLSVDVLDKQVERLMALKEEFDCRVWQADGEIPMDHLSHTPK